MSFILLSRKRISKIKTAIATRRAKTVGTALKLTAESFEQLLKLGGRGVKTLGKAPQSFAQTVIALFRYLRKLNVQKLLDDLIALMVKLFKTTKQVAEETFNKLFENGAKRSVSKAGYAPSGLLDDIVLICPRK